MAKLSHDKVGYEHPAKGPDHCGICRHFERPDGCDIVRPPIAPEDWCNRFTRKLRVPYRRERRG